MKPELLRRGCPPQRRDWPSHGAPIPPPCSERRALYHPASQRGSRAQLVGRPLLAARSTTNRLERISTDRFVYSLTSRWVGTARCARGRPMTYPVRNIGFQLEHERACIAIDHTYLPALPHQQPHLHMLVLSKADQQQSLRGRYRLSRLHRPTPERTDYNTHQNLSAIPSLSPPDGGYAAAVDARALAIFFFFFFKFEFFSPQSTYLYTPRFQPDGRGRLAVCSAKCKYPRRLPVSADLRVLGVARVW